MHVASRAYISAGDVVQSLVEQLSVPRSSIRLVVNRRIVGPGEEALHLECGSMVHMVMQFGGCNSDKNEYLGHERLDMF